MLSADDLSDDLTCADASADAGADAAPDAYADAGADGDFSPDGDERNRAARERRDRRYVDVRAR